MKYGNKLTKKVTNPGKTKEHHDLLLENKDKKIPNYLNYLSHVKNP